MPARPDLASLLIQEPGHPEIYLVDDLGFRRHVPNPATLTGLFGERPTITSTTEVPNVTEGAALSDGAVLARPEDQDPIFLVSNDIKRHIANPAVLDKYQFFGNVSVVPHILLDSIRNGTELSSPS